MTLKTKQTNKIQTNRKNPSRLNKTVCEIYYILISPNLCFDKNQCQRVNQRVTYRTLAIGLQPVSYINRFKFMYLFPESTKIFIRSLLYTKYE